DGLHVPVCEDGLEVPVHDGLSTVAAGHARRGITEDPEVIGQHFEHPIGGVHAAGGANVRLELRRHDEDLAWSVAARFGRARRGHDHSTYGRDRLFLGGVLALGLLARRRTLFFRPSLPVPGLWEMRVPASHRAKVEARTLAITGRDAAGPVDGVVK